MTLICLPRTDAQANKGNPDITGERGADYYAETVKDASDPAMLKGSLPTVRTSPPS